MNPNSPHLAKLLWLVFSNRTTVAMFWNNGRYRVHGATVSDSTIRAWEGRGWVTQSPRAIHLTEEGVAARDEH